MFKQEEDLVLVVAGICSAFAVVISSLLIRRHLIHFSRPVVQVRCYVCMSTRSAIDNSRRSNLLHSETINQDTYNTIIATKL